MAEEYPRMLFIVPDIKEMLTANNKQELRDIFNEFEPVEIAEIIGEFTVSQKVALFSLWDVDFAADVFEKIDKNEQLGLLSAIDEVRKGKILDELAPDERVDLFEELPAEKVDRFLSIMEKEEARDVRQLLSYEANTAGRLMTTEFARISPRMTAGEALDSLRKSAKDLEMIYYIYVLNEKEELVGVLSLKELILANPKRKISEIMHTHLIIIPVSLDQEKVADEIAKYDFLALPVTDKKGNMKGIITVDDIIDVIEEENTEDMYKFGAAGEPPQDYMSMKPLSIARNRLTWLLILVVTGLVSGLIMQKFSFALEDIIALAFYIPLLMGTAGNACTQAAMVVVRGLATGEVRLMDIWQVLKKEFFVGVTLGIPLAIFALIRAIILQKNPFLALSVGLSMLVTVTTATSLGSILPLMCKKLGIDPAVVSGPLITTVLDISSLLIYFKITTYLLKLA